MKLHVLFNREHITYVGQIIDSDWQVHCHALNDDDCWLVHTKIKSICTKKLCNDMTAYSAVDELYQAKSGVRILNIPHTGRTDHGRYKRYTAGQHKQRSLNASTSCHN